MGAIWASVLVVYVPDKPRRGASAFQESHEIDGSPPSVVVFLRTIDYFRERFQN
ncbi:hypothetical protein SAMN05443574_12116 [Haloarcula vallismortis]|uniref:Uncharacterized protein n=1 Tax=Haloarcula vallismortis TaxID=28442 RepID=A0A1H3A3B1_HALVA|nr:hypothetical protein SAMN05443574_12116 [Haloarcula vallismortis]